MSPGGALTRLMKSCPMTHYPPPLGMKVRNLPNRKMMKYFIGELEVTR